MIVARMRHNDRNRSIVTADPVELFHDSQIDMACRTKVLKDVGQRNLIG
jgi:hypothetical protein